MEDHEFYCIYTFILTLYKLSFKVSFKDINQEPLRKIHYVSLINIAFSDLLYYIKIWGVISKEIHYWYSVKGKYLRKLAHLGTSKCARVKRTIDFLTPILAMWFWNIISPPQSEISSLVKKSYHCLQIT